MNAAVHFASLLAPTPARRLASRAFEIDLTALLNRARRTELEQLARELDVAADGEIGLLRARLWRRGAELEAGGPDQLDRPWQLVPAAIGGRLVPLGPVRGLAPPSGERPRAIPPEAAPPAPGDEPDCLEDLLARATAILGVRLGAPRRDKGQFGTRIAAMLGVRERGVSEPDWRGEVEIKTVPVSRDRGGMWRVAEDPAISMDGVPPERKLERVLWIARVSAADSPILSWYYQERDAVVTLLARRYLHTRPKGPAGATTRGWYLQKKFFAASGFLRTLVTPELAA